MTVWSNTKRNGVVADVNLDNGKVAVGIKSTKSIEEYIKMANIYVQKSWSLNN